MKEKERIGHRCWQLCSVPKYRVWKFTAATKHIVISESRRNRKQKRKMINWTVLDADNKEYEIVTFFAMLIQLLKIISFLLTIFSSETIKISSHSLCHRVLQLVSVQEASDYSIEVKRFWLRILNVLWNIGNRIWWLLTWIQISLKLSVKVYTLSEFKKIQQWQFSRLKISSVIAESSETWKKQAHWNCKNIAWDSKNLNPDYPTHCLCDPEQLLHLPGS